MKVIFLDIDGTLVDYNTKLPESAIKAVKEAIKKGNKIYLTTGRSKAEVYDYLWDLGINGMIGGNGMYIEDDGVVLQDLVMDYEEEKEAVEWMLHKGIEFYVESKNGLFASKNFCERAANLISDGDESKVKAIFPHMIYDGQLIRDDVAKISFLIEGKVLEEAKERFQDKLKVSSWSATGKKQEFGEFAIKGIEKVKAVNTLLSYLHTDIEHTFAFGDAVPDIQMIKYCNVGVAMGNAADEVKEASDFVTTDVTEDGLYKAFKEYELI